MAASVSASEAPASAIVHARTRARLLECALRAVAEHGADGDLVQQVCELAEVPATEFARHFASKEELLHVLAGGLSNELIAIIESAAGDFVDPAKRIACGVRIYLEVARTSPLFAKFVARQGLGVVGAASLIHRYLPRHVASGAHTARFAETSVEVAIDLISGTTLSAVARIAEGGATDEYTQDIAAAILRGLGVPAAQARRLAIVDPPRTRPPAGSLLARVQSMA